MKNSVILLLGCILPYVAKAENITFLDSHVKTVCVENWDTSGDGELSKEEAAAVTTLNTVFSFDAEVIRFPELKYFTGLSSIETYDFYNCKSMLNIELPPQITSIGSSAFFGCYNLLEIVIPSAVNTISEFAFNGCSSLRTVTFSEGLTTIGEYAFSSCRSLQSLSIPASVTNIALSAFWSCSSLATITVDAANTVYDSREDCNGLIKTSTNTLQLGITTTVIPKTVTAIGPSAFYGNSKIQTFHIPEGVTTIGSSAFSGCTSLTNITLPSTLTLIDDDAFSGCKKLSSIILPEGLTTIGQSVFKNCSGLRKVFIPSSVPKIGYNAFTGCSRLLKVAVGSTTPITIGSSTFPSYKNATLYVPKGCLETYQNANIWKDFLKIVELGGTLTATVTPEQMDQTTTATLTLDLANDDFHNYHSLQMDITLPQRFHLDDSDLVLSDRCTGMTVTLEQLEGNIYRLTCSSESSNFTGTEGTLLTIGLHISNGVAAGNYQGLAQHVVMTDEQGTTQPLDDAAFSWSVLGFALGDVNHDGFVNVTDVTLTVNHILGQATPVFHEENADFNHDNSINVTDVTGIVNLILKNQ